MPLIENQRDKLLHAIIYFVQHTKNCYKTKLFKLLFFLDFMHYKETGSSVTGLNYFAWPKGPVPRDLYDEMEAPKDDFSKILAIYPTKLGTMDSDAITIKSKIKFKPKLFSKHELKLLEDLSEIYRDSKASLIIESTHLKNSPWDKVYNQEKRKQQIIPYSYALDAEAKVTLEQIQEKEEDLDIIRKVFG